MQPESSKQTSPLQAAWIETLSRYHWDLFGTLTFPEETHPEAAYKKFRLFISILNRKLYGPRWFKKGEGITWCVALEYQRRGVAHFHCLLAEPALIELHKASWHLAQNGRWQNELNELWLDLAGFARVHRIDNLEAVQRYVSKYVVKGGEIDLGGPLDQRRMDQVRVGAIVKPGPAGEATDGNNSDSVPGLSSDSGLVGGFCNTEIQTAASNLSSIRSRLEQVPKGQAISGEAMLPQMSLALD